MVAELPEDKPAMPPMQVAVWTVWVVWAA